MPAGADDQHRLLSSDAQSPSPPPDEAPALSTRQVVVLASIHAAVGVSNTMQGVALRVFLTDELRAGPDLQALIFGVMMAAPWNLKIFFAFLSDCVPICGQRRKPYLFAGIAVQALGWVALGMLQGSIGLVAALGFFVTMGQVAVGTMCDAVVVENMQFERGEHVGSLQTNCWIALSAGSLVGTLGGGEGAAHLGSQAMFVMTGLAKLALVPLTVCLYDPTVVVGAAVPAGGGGGGGGGGEAGPGLAGVVSEQFEKVYNAMKEQRVFNPVLFIFVYAAWPNSGDAFTVFLLRPEVPPRCSAADGGLGFTDAEYSYVLMVSSFGGMLGTMLYKRFLLNAPWRPLFAGTIVVAAAIGCTTLILIFRINREWGIPDIVFALGDDVIMMIANQFVAMPMLILMAQICPVGVESSVFALVTSLQMVGATVGGSLSSTATIAFGVTLDDFSNLWKLTLFTALIHLGSLCLLPLIPSKSVDAAAGAGKSSIKWAATLTVLLVGGLSYSLCNAITTISMISKAMVTHNASSCCLALNGTANDTLFEDNLINQTFYSESPDEVAFTVGSMKAQCMQACDVLDECGASQLDTPVAGSTSATVGSASCLLLRECGVVFADNETGKYGNMSSTAFVAEYPPNHLWWLPLLVAGLLSTITAWRATLYGRGLESAAVKTVSSMPHHGYSSTLGPPSDKDKTDRPSTQDRAFV